MLESSDQIYFLPTLFTNLHAGFELHTRSTAKLRLSLHDDWSKRLGENRPDQSSQTFGGFNIKSKHLLEVWLELRTTYLPTQQRVLHIRSFAFGSLLQSIVRNISIGQSECMLVAKIAMLYVSATGIT